MHKHNLKIIGLIITVLALAGLAAQTQPVVHAVLFFSPTCPHCHKVMENDLPPLLETFGSQLQILQVDITTVDGQMLYQEAVSFFQIPDNRIGVPNLTIGNTYLVGSEEIPALLPGIIEDGLAAGGIDWPSIPGVTAALEEGTFPYFGSSEETLVQPGLTQRFGQDPIANSIALIVLLAMVAVVIRVWTIQQDRRARKGAASLPEWAFPVLILAGIGISGYLTFVESTGSEAICGPVGDCNLVQQSEYSKIFGVLPVGALGIAAYAFIFFTWSIHKYGRGEQQKYGNLGLRIATWAGVIFSIYLTFLEPFVIGASCAWCLGSALVMTLLFYEANRERYPKVRIQKGGGKKQRRHGKGVKRGTRV